jgi:hypothetical protein
VKIFVGGNDDGKVRFRFWSSKMDVKAIGKSDRIHNHSFDFKSFILCGEVLERRYNIVFDPAGSHQVWEVENLGGRSVLRKTTITCNLSEGEPVLHF